MKKDEHTRVYTIGADGQRYEKGCEVSRDPGASQNSNLYSSDQQIKYIEKRVEVPVEKRVEVPVEKVIFKEKIVEKVVEKLVKDPKLQKELDDSKKTAEGLENKLAELRDLGDENNQMAHHFASSTTQLMIQIERVKAQNRLISQGFGHLVGNALLEESYNNLSKKYEDLAKENESLSDQFKQIIERNNEAEQDNKNLIGALDNIQNENNYLKQKAEDDEKDAKKRAEDEKETHEMKLAAMEKEMKELKEGNAKLLDQLDHDAKTMVNLAATVSGEREAGDKHSESQKKLEKDLEDLKHDNKKLKEDKESDKKTTFELSKKLVKAEEENKKFEEEIEELKKKLKEKGDASSDETDKPGPWSGNFEQNGTPFDFNVDKVSFLEKGKMEGNGSDQYGDYKIEGFVNQSGEIKFLKTYFTGVSEGASISYSGNLKGDIMDGTWEVVGNSSVNGKFMLKKGAPSKADLKAVRSEEKTESPAWDDKMGAVTGKKEAGADGDWKDLSENLMKANTKLMLENAQTKAGSGGKSGESDKMKNLENAIGQNEGAISDLKNIELRYSQLQSLYENTLTQYRGVLAKIIK